MFQINKTLGATMFVCMVSLSSYGESVTINVANGEISNYNALGTTADVTLEGLSLNAGEWRGVCFPFTATKEQLDGAFGEGNWIIRAFDRLEGNTVYTTSVSSVQPEKAYAIYVTNGVTNPIFSGVTVANTVNYTVYSSDVSGGDGLSARCNYLRTDLNSAINYSESNYAWTISSTGALVNMTSLSDVWGGVRYAYSWLYNGTNSTALRLKLTDGADTGAGDSDDSGSDDSGNTGGGDGGYVYDENSLEGKIERRKQLTDVPTLYLTIPDVAADGSDLNSVVYKEQSAPFTADYHDAAMLLVGDNDETLDQEVSDYLEIKVRGNSTSWPEKKPYRLKFAKKHKHDLLGYGYSKRNWTLLANAFDRSLIRNAVTYHLSKAFGMPFVAGYRFVDVVINNSYRGTYQISDHIEADADRVNIDEDNGWMLEFVSENRFLDDYYINESNLPLTNIKNPDGDDFTDKKSEVNNAALQQQWSALTSEIKDFVTDWKTSLTAGDYITKDWRDYNDVETLIKFYLITNLTGDFDGFFTIKAYKDVDAKQLSWGPIWDKDIAYGNCQYAPNDVTLVENYDKSNYRWYFSSKLNKEPQFVAQAKMVLDKVVADGLKDMLVAKVDELGTQVSKTWEQNFTKWDITATQSGEISRINGANGYTTQQQYIDQLKSFISGRVDFVQNAVNANYVAAGSPSTTITAKVGKGGWGTFSYPLTVDFSKTGLRVFKGNYYNGKVYVTEIPNGIVPAGTGVLIKGTAGETVSPELVIGWADKLTENELVGTHSGAYTATQSKTTYVLNSEDDGTGRYVSSFYPLRNGSSVAQYKAYITISAEQGAKPVIMLDDVVTGISEIAPEGPSLDAPTYNTMGVRVGEQYKGIVIQNGKKYVVK